MANGTSNNRTLIYIVIAIVVAFIAYSVLNKPDTRSTGQRLSDAVDELPNGVDKAARELKDRTPGEKVGDAIKDTGEKIKDNSR